MIIQKYEIFDARRFAAGLARAVRGVLRVGVDSEIAAKGIGSFASAWLITDTLAVVSDYVLTSQSLGPRAKYFCYPSPEQGETRPIAADPVQDLPPGSEGLRPALLRLREPLPDCALTLRVESLEMDDLVLVLHYPHARPEPQLSIGRLIGKEGRLLRYDAGTEPGSGGGPILSPTDWALSGMHMIGSRQRFNQGLSLAAILEVLQESESWAEIARFHNLAGVTRTKRSLDGRAKSEPAATDTTLLAAAVRWSFNPKSFRKKQLDQLRAFVNDPSANLWTIRASERQAVLRSAGSLDELRKVRGKGRAKDIGQKVIDRILKGPPYELDKIDEAALPYWLQAVRWFADVAPSLPTSAEVNKNLERRRIKSRLQAIVGADFRGRDEQLEELKSWYLNPKAGPMVVSGIGGVGKSALVAQFIQLLPDDPQLLWLDFDRADLAPDDAVSVLTLLSEQISVQLHEYSLAQVTESSWKEVAHAIGAVLVRTPPPLLVLDGFEVAQQVQQHNEIWQVLKLILAVAPDLRIIISGRAPVKDLDLDGRTSDKIHLTGMALQDAKAWLRERGVTDDKVLERVAKISEGVPLVLVLALRLIEDGGPIAELPQDLPIALVKGFLYERILDRVIDPVLKPVAQDALVLRSLTEAMIPEVLSDRIPAGLDAQEVFSRLSLEMGLVGDESDPRALSVLLPGKSDMIHLRPEVRTATLKLLEKDNAERVRTIDERAVDWYGKQDLTDVANAAELVYHNLRLGNIKKAEEAWLAGCGILLIYAEEDLPETAEAERAWLRVRTNEGALAFSNLERWEKEAAERIKEALGRGLLRVVPNVLKEREQRSATSPLALYDAWTCWQEGDLAGARERLGVVKEISGPNDRNRAVLGALFAARSGDRAASDKLLAILEDQQRWSDRPNGSLEALAVRASRIRLAVDLRSELELLQFDPWVLAKLSRFLTASDVVLPRLRQRIGDVRSLEAVSASVPSSQAELDDLRLRLEQERSWSRSGGAELLPSLDQEISPTGPWRANDLNTFQSEPERPHDIALAQDLAVLGWRRWRLAMNSLFIFEACELALARRTTDYTLSLAIAGTLAGFRGYQMSFAADTRLFRTLDELLLGLGLFGGKVVTPHPLPTDRISLAKSVLLKEDELALANESMGPTVKKMFSITGEVQGVGFRSFAQKAAEQHKLIGSASKLPDESIQVFVEGPESSVEALKKELATGPASAKVQQVEETTLVRDYFPRSLMSKIERPEIFSVLLFLLGPDPLEMLGRRVVGLPDDLN